MSDLGYNLRCVIDVHILAGLSQSDPHVCISYDQGARANYRPIVSIKGI